MNEVLSDEDAFVRATRRALEAVVAVLPAAFLAVCPPFVAVILPNI